MKIKKVKSEPFEVQGTLKVKVECSFDCKEKLEHTTEVIE